MKKIDNLIKGRIFSSKHWEGITTMGRPNSKILGKTKVTKPGQPGTTMGWGAK